MSRRRMTKYVKGLMALNLAAVVRGIRFGPAELSASCRRAFHAVDPFEARRLRATSEQFASLPRVDLGAILGERKPCVRLNVMAYEDGMLPPVEALALLAILAVEEPKEVLEIGTYNGYTTRLLAENLEVSIIHTIDLPEDYDTDTERMGMPKDGLHLIERRMVGREFKGRDCEKGIQQHFADTAEWDFSEAGESEFFFIDGSHTYEYCKNDSEKCFELSGGKGVFLWHDCDVGHPGVVKLISEWRDLGRDVLRIKGTALAYLKSV